ncbi:AfsR/SARP family transcriptional regulator [Streptomyces heilongjiangensis]|uniref:Tetratricopeptide repeat protein n=1 Tax=Streptomyces heilongjiangensis TaxID=945052 RepID=A0ABW1B6X4_9ACTN|nr:tetratricopeptide repeat protein [Streptomyces heilongjiangensis]MDC2950423.1 tetratricopeptide repeat protein [Streptomyces heilongjiangensis]
MEIHVLGPVGLGVQQGRLGLGSGKEASVLAALALDVGRPVPLDCLVDRLWDDPPGRARENVHTYVSRLRRAIREAAPGPGAPAITHRTHTYTLVTAPETVDWHRFLHLADRAGSVAAEGDDTRAAALFREAEALWTEPLAGLPGLWARRVRCALAEKRRAVVGARVAVELRLGCFAETAGELSALVDEYRGDEALAGQLMVAYYGGGRQAEALHLYQRVRRILRTEFGTDPGEELVRVHRHILAGGSPHDLVRRPAAPRPASPAAVRPQRVPDHLPRQGPLVGRRAEMERIRSAIDTASRDGAVVTLESISGMAGVGKSALAIRAAHEFTGRFPDGSLYVNLRAHTQGQEPLTPGAALATLLRLLEVPPQSIPADVEERAALWRQALGHRRALIILDDAAGPEQVRPLLPGTTECFVLITSRRRLVGLPRGRSLALDVLPLADAVALFRECAGLGGSRTTDTTGNRAERGEQQGHKEREGRERRAEQEELEEIVRLCGQLPLAIEIAANRLSAHPSWDLTVLRGLLSRTTDRLAQIRDGYSEIARAFEVSYQTLSPAEQSAFRLLSLHPGPEFGPHAAAALLGRPLDETERLLESLLQCHLLQEPVPNRFRFHDLLGEYAHLLCNAQDTDERRDEARARLLDHYLRTADHCDRLLYPRRIRLDVPDADPAARSAHLPVPRTAADALTWFTAERQNLLSAEQRLRAGGSPARAALLSHVLAGFLDGECHWTDALRLHGAAAEHWRGAGRREEWCRALLDLCAAYTATGRFPEADRTAREALTCARAVGDRDAQAEALRELGVLHWHMGRYPEALDFQRESLTLCAPAGDRWRVARCQNNIAICLLYLSEHADALSWFQDAIEGFEATDDERMLAKTLNNLGNLFLRTGDPERARRTLERSLRIAERTGSPSDRAILQINLAEIHLLTGKAPAAVALCREALPVFRRMGAQKNEAITLTRLGCAHRALSDVDRAADHLRHALTLARDIGAALEEIQARRALGVCEFERGRSAAAVRHLSAAIEAARQLGAAEEEAGAKEALEHIRTRVIEFDRLRL